MRYALTYGLLSGAVIAGIIAAGLLLVGMDGFTGSVWFGYLVMLVAMSFIFVGVKRFRDNERGGVIRFLPAFGMGLAIAAVAGLAYVAMWEAYLAVTDYAFMDQYIANIVRARQEAGVAAEAIAREVAEMREMADQYRNPLFRIPITFLEIFPVGLLVALISAALLRNPRLLPATSRG